MPLFDLVRMDDFLEKLLFQARQSLAHAETREHQRRLALQPLEDLVSDGRFSGVRKGNNPSVIAPRRHVG